MKRQQLQSERLKSIWPSFDHDRTMDAYQTEHEVLRREIDMKEFFVKTARVRRFPKAIHRDFSLL
jgi:hypothetical protein